MSKFGLPSGFIPVASLGFLIFTDIGPPDGFSTFGRTFEKFADSKEVVTPGTSGMLIFTGLDDPAASVIASVFCLKA